MSAKNFAKIPEALLFDPEISHVAVRLYGVIQRYAGKGGTAFPGREELAVRLGVHLNTVKRALVELTEAGWIERTRRPGSNIWDTTVCVAPTPGRGTTDEPTLGTTDGPRFGKRGTTDGPTSVPQMSRPSVPQMVRLDEREPMNESQLTRVTAQPPAPRRPADDDVIDAEIIDELPINLPTVNRTPDPVQVLVGAYVTAVEATGGIATKSQRAAIGRNVKRLIADDGIPLPVLLVAVQRAGAKRTRAVDPFLGDVQAAYDRASTRRAMFDRWAEIAARIDQKGQPA